MCYEQCSNDKKLEKKKKKAKGKQLVQIRDADQKVKVYVRHFSLSDQQRAFKKL